MTLFGWFVSQPAISIFSHQITSTTSQLEVLFSHNKSATATSHSQPEVLSLMKL